MAETDIGMFQASHKPSLQAHPLALSGAGFKVTCTNLLQLLPFYCMATHQATLVPAAKLH
jgi:hypothetical protein